MEKVFEVVSEHIDDDNFQHIDAYFDDDPDSTGKTVAIVCLDTGKVFFLDNLYADDEKVKVAIKEVVDSVDRVAQATKVVKQAGYFFDERWNLKDIQDCYQCSDEEARAVLKKALTNRNVVSEIQLAIGTIATESDVEINHESKGCGDVINRTDVNHIESLGRDSSLNGGDESDCPYDLHTDEANYWLESFQRHQQ